MAPRHSAHHTLPFVGRVHANLLPSLCRKLRTRCSPTSPCLAESTLHLVLRLRGGGHKSNPWKKAHSKMRWKWKKKRTRRLQRKRRSASPLLWMFPGWRMLFTLLIILLAGRCASAASSHIRIPLICEEAWSRQQEAAMPWAVQHDDPAPECFLV